MKSEKHFDILQYVIDIEDTYLRQVLDPDSHIAI